MVSQSPSSSPMPQSPSNSSASDSSSSDSTSSSSPASMPNLDSQSSSSSSANSSFPGTNDGLRYRSGFPSYHPHTPPGVPHCPDAAEFPLQGGLPASMPPHPAYIPMQMLWWQQMYARQYYMQYQAAVAASQPPSSLSPSSSPHQPAQPNEAVQAPLGPNPAQDPNQENLPANPIQMNAQGGALLDDDELNRDWLDWLYTVSRAGVLLSIVYFYSSFSHFVMVVGAMLLVYLHQAQWFPFRPQQQHFRGEERADAPPGEAQRQQDIEEIERLMDEGLEDDDSGEEGGVGSRDGALGAALPEPNILTVAWSFISTFFTSLIPEVQPHPAN
ncbi:homocysteine-responsive endoplasmic reticulum-resident ubiquitin-like domain member 2 protein isoform X2 [Cyprinodon tularosa]|uniref:homocysteine-responsive endoplasmic reticulum-resident ubiquitin-like domain member 2 protein isoform X2 n=1 Tax=Cyprinodon tularosa TaxID=77115 RepID=UPI0018E1F019|nr:homocysteine-responsive endoplasmic reticulum-resident ubiquitin-like domain member 2 protein isoform X2 [Cyprinodon tularosa]XP_038135527.1 homocysteine-responsive endoplasmic reticulum-resident ubiquitin-like domain member 2 protein isoform X2 [Cyprinodon tularosa]XP_038135528.1 homocysteine-responsive endoplasmic reticulum-resident ubiquitin-like domain member 2 protein isoform X2 [Cyprinodon tularosa]